MSLESQDRYAPQESSSHSKRVKRRFPVCGRKCGQLLGTACRKPVINRWRRVEIGLYLHESAKDEHNIEGMESGGWVSVKNRVGGRRRALNWPGRYIHGQTVKKAGLSNARHCNNCNNLRHQQP